MVIFGASGDLTRRKLIPALYNLAKNELLSREFAVIGVARSPMSTEDFRKKVSEDIKQFATDKVDPDIWEWFVRRIYYLSGDMGDKNLYLQLKDLLDKVDKDHSTHGNHMYYLATAAGLFRPDGGATGGSRTDAGGRSALAAGRHRKAFRTRSRIRPAAEPATAAGGRAKSRSTASITIWARKPSRTFWRCASPTESSSRSGTAATSITSRFRWRKRSASRSAAATTTRPARCATWCPTTSCSSSA